MMSLAGALPQFHSCLDDAVRVGHDQEAEVAQARAAALREGFAQAEAHYSQELSAQADAQAAQLSEALVQARIKWVAAESTVLAQTLVDAIAERSEVIAGSVMTALQEFFGQRLRLEEHARFERSLKVALKSDLSQGVTLHGPDDLVAALSGALHAKGITALRTGTDRDLAAEIAETRLTSNLSTWLQALEVCSP